MTLAVNLQDNRPYRNASISPNNGVMHESTILHTSITLDEVLAKVKELESKCSARPSAIYDLDEHHRLKQPILIVLEEMDDSVLASWPELHLYAEGENPNSAIATLKREIIALYDDLNSSEADQLGEMPLRWRATLSHVILENG